MIILSVRAKEEVVIVPGDKFMKWEYIRNIA